MSEKKRVLLIAQEMEPYTEGGVIADIASKLPLFANDKGFEFRILMPRFGSINERRHRLHEVVRLSGMNIIVQDDDYPLIIKVASLPNSRLQVYFLDNDDFFKRKQMFADDSGEPFEDNADRMVFFCKGALETVRKFGWAPDIVHCHGWMTSLVPAYLKMAYKQEALFQNAKIIYSQYEQGILPDSENFFAKAAINHLGQEDLQPYQNGAGINLHYGAAHFSDAVIAVGGDAPAVGADKPVLQHESDQADFLGDYLAFYQGLIS
jgi:starch synthase